MRYADQNHTEINVGDDWQALGFEGQRIPCVPGNSDYNRIVREGLLDQVLPYEAPAPAVAESVTPWQAREALRLAGILAQVNAHIDGLGDDHAAYVAWHYAERIRRNSPFVETLAPTFGLSEAQLDALFVQAASLSL